MERASSESAYNAIHEKTPWHDGSFTSWAADRSAKHPVPLNGDYIKVGVASHDLTPHDSFTTDRNASPLPPESEQPATEQEGHDDDGPEDHS